jgi:hypothetical protein
MLDTVFAEDVQVVIERDNESTAVVISHRQWSQTQQRLQEFERILLADQRSAELDADPTLHVPWETIKQNLVERGLIDG